MADIINNNDNRELTEEEIKAYQKQIGDCLEASNQLTKNFKLYIGVYGSSKKFQVSHISKEDYELLQDPLKCQNVKSLKEFYNSLGETEDHTSKKAILLTEDNFAMAFHPAVWNVLKFEERIAAMRVAWKKFTGKDVTEFCNSISTTIAYVGSDYQGSLNIGSIIAYAFEYGSWNLLKNLANTTNCLKMNYYFNQSKQKEYNYITDFESFEEMQYVSPLEPIETDVEKMSDDVKAVYYSQLNRREQRKNFLKADYLIIDHSEELKGILPDFDEKIQKEIYEIKQINRLITNELGYSQKVIDEEYLKAKVELYNNNTAKEYNKVVEKYTEIDTKIKSLKKPLLEATKLLREKKEEIKKELENANDAIEMSMLKDEIDDLTKKINKIYDKHYKKEVKEINKLSKQRDEIYAELQEIDSHMITLEGAKKHFESYFNATSKFETANTTNNKTDDDKKSYTEIPENENLELN